MSIENALKCQETELWKRNSFADDGLSLDCWRSRFAKNETQTTVKLNRGRERDSEAHRWKRNTYLHVSWEGWYCQTLLQRVLNGDWQ